MATNPMRWVPSLYFTQGMQFFVVMYLVAFPLKNLGIANDQIAHWTGLIGTAWAVKPLWSPFLELLKSKKTLVVAMQGLGAGALALIALSLQLPHWFAAVIAVLFLVAYASATHDIACDGLYMAALDHERQARYAGWQSAAGRAMLKTESLADIAARVERDNINPQPRSGQQEYLENLVNRFV